MNNSSFAVKMDWLKSIVIIVIILILVLISFNQLTPPKVLPETAPADVFSAERAMRHLRIIAQQPHPIGSKANRMVRDYIVEQLKLMGLESQIQATTIIRDRKVAWIENIIVRINGVENSKAILVMSHYDSVPDGPGASDDGSGVVSMLETIRALLLSPALKNDVIFLFTDGEEMGLLGAKAFRDEHSFAKEIGLVLNFDARGHKGPVILHETSDQNGRIISEFAKVAPKTIAASWAYEVAKLLSSASDFLIFKNEIPGLNFAYICGDTHYHTTLDNSDNIDQRSLQHTGMTMLRAARQFGNRNLNNIKASNAVYFNFLGLIIHYPESWAIPLMIVTIILFIIVFLMGLKRGLLNIPKLLISAVIFLVVAAGSAGITYGLWKLIRLIHPVYTSFGSNTYNRDIYFAAFCFFTLTVFTFVYSIIRKKIGEQNFLMGVLLCWLFLMIGTSLLLEGFSYMLVIPMICGLSGLMYKIIFTDKKAMGGCLMIAIDSLLAIPIIMLYPPSFYLMSIALGLKLTWSSTLFLVFLISMLLPLFNIMLKPNRWWLPALTLSLSVLFLIIGITTSHFDSKHPKPSMIRYLVDADDKKAYWVKFRYEDEQWYSQFFKDITKRNDLEKFGLHNILKSEAKYYPLIEPKLVILEDFRENGIRKLKTKIIAPEKRITVIISDTTLTEVKVNGKTIKYPVNEFYAYGITEKGMELEIRLKSMDSFQIMVQTYDNKLNEIPGLIAKKRPDYLMPHRNIVGVVKTFTIPSLIR